MEGTGSFAYRKINLPMKNLKKRRKIDQKVIMTWYILRLLYIYFFGVNFSMSYSGHSIIY